eukprot:s6672_g4.t1
MSSYFNVKNHEIEAERERGRERNQKRHDAQGANVSKVGTKTNARKRVGKADEATKKKLGEIVTSQAADFVKGTEDKGKKPTKEPKDSAATHHLA